MILTCRELVEHITNRKEGKLGSVDQVTYELHLLWCMRCREYVRQLDLTIGALAHLSDDEPAESRTAPEVEAAARARVVLREKLRQRKR
jgi:predicted anti-sigma-YlaC factor YlaD